MASFPIFPSPARRTHRGFLGRAFSGAVFGCAILPALCAFFSAPPDAHAQGDDARLLGAHILVIRGDLRRLDEGRLPAAQKKGLRRRITGMLGSLAWQLRLNDDAPSAPQARAYAQNWRAPEAKNDLTRWLDALIARHPLDTSPYDPALARPQDRAKALALHNAYCAACHGATPQDAPPEDAAVARPARSLYTMVRNQSRREFTARMVSGVRGDRATGLANPLGNAQIAALIALYQDAKPHP
ncbi:hypothetical protein [Varunaivibrio sulfuroxidans]|uniref:Cytochrome c domain-containing protein n=1 Tax=Varunaivibrio sulfuroxidans TaxID=1773489 RepID=A0A4R3J5J8_9PROT|nr:hypothetical protein [Varunaivibrio sulfuroxidans]TCS60597.1 hypothetical protein EDD55_11072 [Varunaivibrio sulfuroxidans]WES30087.1 hypothetical protein P3M64_10625 [Varunaivibrio sulfuroxidans]